MSETNYYSNYLSIMDKFDDKYKFANVYPKIYDNVFREIRAKICKGLDEMISKKAFSATVFLTREQYEVSQKTMRDEILELGYKVHMQHDPRCSGQDGETLCDDKYYIIFSINK